MFFSSFSVLFVEVVCSPASLATETPGNYRETTGKLPRVDRRFGSRSQHFLSNI